MDYFFGDSQTLNPPSGVSFYPWLYEMMKGNPFAVKAVPGSCAADVVYQMLANPLSSGDRGFLMLGNNDREWYGGGATQLQLFDVILRALANFATHTPIKCNNAAWTFGTNWSSWDAFSTGESFTQWTNTNGATTSIQFSGDSFDLCYLLNDADPSGFNWHVDSGASSFCSCMPPHTIASKNAHTWAPSILHGSGYGAGMHTLHISAAITLANGINLCWLAGSANGASMNFLTAPRSLIDADALTDAYNGQLVATAAACGIGLIDTHSIIDPNIDLVIGEVHMHMGNFKVAKFLSDWG